MFSRRRLYLFYRQIQTKSNEQIRMDAKFRTAAIILCLVEDAFISFTIVSHKIKVYQNKFVQIKKSEILFSSFENKLVPTEMLNNAFQILQNLNRVCWLPLNLENNVYANMFSIIGSKMVRQMKIIQVVEQIQAKHTW